MSWLSALAVDSEEVEAVTHVEGGAKEGFFGLALVVTCGLFVGWNRKAAKPGKA